MKSGKSLPNQKKKNMLLFKPKILKATLTTLKKRVPLQYSTVKAMKRSNLIRCLLIQRCSFVHLDFSTQLFFSNSFWTLSSPIWAYKTWVSIPLSLSSEFSEQNTFPKFFNARLQQVNIWVAVCLNFLANLSTVLCSLHDAKNHFWLEFFTDSYPRWCHNFFV